MPIKKENKHRYPANWPQISAEIRFGRAGYRCECVGECGESHAGRCAAIHGLKNPRTGSKVVLTVAHLNHQPEDCRLENLMAACQACHLAYDREIHAANRHRTRMAKATGDTEPLFEMGDTA